MKQNHKSTADFEFSIKNVPSLIITDTLIVEF